MSEAAAVQFLTTLQTNFRQKRHESEAHEESWVAMMIRELKGYAPQVLEQAAIDLARKRKNEYFPILADCLHACNEAKHWIDAANPRLKFAATQASPMSDDRTRLADSLVMGEMGRQAARDGWILTLHDYIRDNGRLPDQSQVSKLKSQAKGFDTALDSCRGGSHPMAGPLRELGLSMLAKRQALAEMVLDGVVR